MTYIACLGDSITLGEGDSLGLGWVGRLNAYMHQQAPLKHGVYNLGICGDSVVDAYQRYHSEVLVRQPHLVLIAVGTNDCLRCGDDKPAELRSGMEHTMYQWSRWYKYLGADLHKTVILGVLPSDESQMPYIYDGEPNNWVLAKDLENYNTLLKDFCQAHNLPFINFWDTWSPAMGKTHTTDGVHPNDAGYDWMFGVIRDFLKDQRLI